MPNYRHAAADHLHKANTPFWYSFEYGSVHFTIISTEHDLSHGSEQNKVRCPACGQWPCADSHCQLQSCVFSGSLMQHLAADDGMGRLTLGCGDLQWLRQDLESVDRCSTPWLIVGMHRPMYVVYPHKSNRVVGSAAPFLQNRSGCCQRPT